MPEGGSVRRLGVLLALLFGLVALGASLGLPEGPGRALVRTRCLPCHDPAEITASAGISRKEWQETVEEMVELGMKSTAQERLQMVQYLATNLGGPETPSPQPADSVALGQKIFQEYCKTCHGAEGKGNDAFPPLAANSRLAANPAYLVATILFGLSGKIESEGRSFTNIMPPLPHFSDSEVAAVANYVLHHFANAGLLPAGFQAVSPQMVARVRRRALPIHEVRKLRPR